MILPSLIIAPSDFGGDGLLGVFSLQDFEIETVIEISPVLVFDSNERDKLESTTLYNYIFEWGENKLQAAIGLGYLSMYNHSYNANCEYEMDFENRTMSIKTVKQIKKGEELFINYNGDADDQTKIWFETLD
jgi:SET domain-containing protein